MRIALSLALLALTACHRERPPAPTEEQNVQLNEMENALDASANAADVSEEEQGHTNPDRD